MSASHIAHCASQIAELAGRGEPTRRDVLQLGYNLGRLAELTGAGREPYWDRWKEAVERWDRPELERLVHRLRTDLTTHPTTRPGSEPAPSCRG